MYICIYIYVHVAPCLSPLHRLGRPFQGERRTAKVGTSLGSFDLPVQLRCEAFLWGVPDFPFGSRLGPHAVLGILGAYRKTLGVSEIRGPFVASLEADHSILGSLWGPPFEASSFGSVKHGRRDSSYSSLFLDPNSAQNDCQSPEGNYRIRRPCINTTPREVVGMTAVSNW